MIEKPKQIKMEIILDQNPRQTSRPRSVLFKGRIVVYMDPKTREFKKMLTQRIKDILYETYGNDLVFPIYDKNDAISMTSRYIFNPSKSRYKILKKQLEEIKKELNLEEEINELPMTMKPDVDNLDKMSMDSSSGVVYEDDCIVYDKHSTKVFNMLTDVAPRIILTFTKK